MDITHAREHLGWTPTVSATDALKDLVAGMSDPTGMDTPPLRARAGGPLRLREVLTGLGRRT